MGSLIVLLVAVPLPPQVRARKEAQREAEGLRGELARLRERLAAAEHALGEARGAADAAHAAARAAGGGAAEAQRLTSLLLQRDNEIRALRGHVSDLESRLAAAITAAQRAASGAGSTGTAAPASPAAAVAPQLEALRARVADLEAENEDLKTELNAFDPAFFEEIEDLKHAHYTLKASAAEQERTIRRLQEQLAAVQGGAARA